MWTEDRYTDGQMDGQKDGQTERHDETSSICPQFFKRSWQESNPKHKQVLTTYWFASWIQWTTLTKCTLQQLHCKVSTLPLFPHLVGRRDYFRTSTTARYVDWEDDISRNISGKNQRQSSFTTADEFICHYLSSLLTEAEKIWTLSCGGEGGNFVKPKKEGGERVIVLEHVWSTLFKTERQFGGENLTFACRNLQEDVKLN